MGMTTPPTQRSAYPSLPLPLLALFLALLLAVPARAGEAPAAAKPPEAPAPVPDEPKDTAATTRHSLKLAGKSLDYAATAGFMSVKLEEGKTSARIFSVAYEAPASAGQSRPVTFAFNGGPGSASLWLHLGALGPRRVALDDDGTAGPPPPHLVDNAETWLAFTDLVFVDPVGTGFSRAIPAKEGEGPDAKPFWGVAQDLDSVGEFIRLWLTRHGRWGSPVYLAGESYGTLRAAGLAAHLFERYGLAVSGLVLVSPVLDYATVAPSLGNDLPYVLLLPSYAAAARFHGRLAPELMARDLPGLLAEAEAFARTDYLLALSRGDGLSPEEDAALNARVAAFTGLAPEVVARFDARIPVTVFSRELLADKRLVVGRMDATVAGPPVTPDGWDGYDPSLDPLLAPFAGAFNAYVKTELGFDSDLVYEPLNPKVLADWDFSSGVSGGQGYVDTSAELRTALVVNPALKVLVACGRFDLATPYLGILHSVAHMRLPLEMRGNVLVRYYPAGHMLYTHPEARRQLLADTAAFYAARQGEEKP